MGARLVIWLSLEVFVGMGPCILNRVALISSLRGLCTSVSYL